MKNTVIFFTLASLMFFASCDKVKNPVETPVSNPTSTALPRKVLLEDYTGHTCPNCPAAAEVAEDLYAQNNGKVIVLAVHAGWFARTKTEFPASYTTTAGNAWDASTGFGVSGSGNPNGMVNRKVYPGYALIHQTWTETVPLALNDTYIMKLDVKTTYDPGSRKLNTDVNAKFAVTYTNNVKVCVVFTEDSIIGPQEDNRLQVTPPIEHDYVFMHMLRGDINGPWGATLKNAPIAVNDSIAVSYPNFSLDTKFKDKNVTVIAFAYDETTKEVLQVEKSKIR